MLPLRTVGGLVPLAFAAGLVAELLHDPTLLIRLVPANSEEVCEQDMRHTELSVLQSQTFLLDDMLVIPSDPPNYPREIEAIIADVDNREHELCEQLLAP